jgi:hypothetical protein
LFYEVLDLLTSGLTQALHVAKVTCIAFDQCGIQVVFTNELAESITDLGTTVVPVAGSRRKLLRFLEPFRPSRGTDFLAALIVPLAAAIKAAPTVLACMKEIK